MIGVGCHDTFIVSIAIKVWIAGSIHRVTRFKWLMELQCKCSSTWNYSVVPRDEWPFYAKELNELLLCRDSFQEEPPRGIAIGH